MSGLLSMEVLSHIGRQSAPRRAPCAARRAQRLAQPLGVDREAGDVGEALVARDAHLARRERARAVVVEAREARDVLHLDARRGGSTKDAAQGRGGFHVA